MGGKLQVATDAGEHDQLIGHARLRRLAIVWWTLPALCVLGVVFGYSLVGLFSEALKFDGEWTLGNFELVVTDPAFRTALWHNAQLLLTVPILVACAYVIAVLLFEGLRGWRFHRAVVFFPFILPIPVVALVFGEMLQLNGVLNTTLRNLGMQPLALDWFGDPRLALWTMTSVIVWKELGFGVVLFLARLYSLPQDTFDAGRVDGARFFKMQWFVTLPQMWGIVALYAVNEAINMISWVFNYVYVITNGQGGPGDATTVTELYIYQRAFQYDVPELAAAAATLLFALALAGIAVLFAIQRWGGKGGEIVG